MDHLTVMLEIISHRMEVILMFAMMGMVLAEIKKAENRPMTKHYFIRKRVLRTLHRASFYFDYFLY
jgi:hypothetical protein